MPANPVLNALFPATKRDADSGSYIGQYSHQASWLSRGYTWANRKLSLSRKVRITSVGEGGTTVELGASNVGLTTGMGPHSIVFQLSSHSKTLKGDDLLTPYLAIPSNLTEKMQTMTALVTISGMVNR